MIPIVIQDIIYKMIIQLKFKEVLDEYITYIKDNLQFIDKDYESVIFTCHLCNERASASFLKIFHEQEYCRDCDPWII